MAARLGLSPGSGCGQESSSQPPRGPTSSVPGVGASGSQSEARGRPEGSPVPSAGGAEVAPESQVRASAPQGPTLVLVAHGGDPQVIATAPGQSTPRDPRDLPPGAVDNGPKWVIISECLRLGFPFICLGRDLPFLPFFISSKRSHGQTDLAPRKALKTAPDCVASAAPGLVIQPTLSRGTSPQGARASPVSGEQAPEASSSAEAAIVVEEAADADVVLSPPVVPAMPAPATAEVAAVPV
jgi:hypothetical protein